MFVFVLNFSITEIELVALLLSLLSMLLGGEFLEIKNHLCLRLSIFSSKLFKALGNLLLFHLKINLDSWIANSSSSWSTLRFWSLVRICWWNGPISFQDFFNTAVSLARMLGFAPPQTFRQYSKWHHIKLSYNVFLVLMFSLVLCLHKR